MQDGALLLIGAGGLGCRWASHAHLDVNEDCDLLLIDSDPSSLELSENASTVCLGPEGSRGCSRGGPGPGLQLPLGGPC